MARQQGVHAGGWMERMVDGLGAVGVAASASQGNSPLQSSGRNEGWELSPRSRLDGVA